MSKKNLARTAIEGGRSGRNKWERHNSHAEERAALKNYLQEVKSDPDNYDEYDVKPIKHVYKDFRDKLSPMYRWLNSQVGRLWNDVYSEVILAFDTRTTAGRHIVYDHLLSSVQIGEEPRRYYSYLPDDATTSYSDNDFYVDEEGILCKKRYLGRSYRNYIKIPPFDTKQIANWLNGRIVGKVGNKFFWFVPTGKNKKHRGGSFQHIWRTAWGRTGSFWSYSQEVGPYFQYLTYDITYKLNGSGIRVLDEKGAPIELERKQKWVNGNYIPSLRQDRKLNQKELNYWHILPEYYQTKILEKSPNYPVPPKVQQRYYY